MPKKRGLAQVPVERRREISSKGGKRAHELGRAHEYTPEEAREAGRKGGLAVSRDREHMAEIGRRGGRASKRTAEPYNGLEDALNGRR